MTSKNVWAPLMILALSPTLHGCAEDKPRSAEHINLDFDLAFRELGRITIEEPHTHPITEITSVDVFSDGRIVVVDEGGGQVRVHAPNGDFLHLIGRTGTGPGEFQNPIDVAIDSENRVYIADTQSPTLQRFDSSFAFDTSFAVGNGYFPFQVEVIDEILLTGMRASMGAPYTLWTPTGIARQTFHEWPEEIIDEPYWRSVVRDNAAICSDRIVVATSMLYPLNMYSIEGAFVRQVGDPPQSWKQAPQLSPGELMGPDQRRRLADWLSTFTVIDKVYCYHDEYIVVTHGKFPSSASDRLRDLFSVNQYALDLYTISDTTRKVVEDVALPGRVLHVNELLYVLIAAPPDSWTIGVFELRESTLTGN